jgi:hypothetical protein
MTRKITLLQAQDVNILFPSRLVAQLLSSVWRTLKLAVVMLREGRAIRSSNYVAQRRRCQEKIVTILGPIERELLSCRLSLIIFFYFQSKSVLFGESLAAGGYLW